MALISSSPWIDHACLAEWVSNGLMGEHGGRALQLQKEGFCTFKPTAPEWLDVVASARQAVLNKSIPSHFTQLAIHSELVDLLTLLYGRRAYPSQCLDFNTARVPVPQSLANQCQSEPLGFLCGAFIALEDIDVDQKCLSLYPGSHYQHSLSSEGTLDVQQQLELNGISSRLIKVAFGDVVIIHSQLIHSLPAQKTSHGFSWTPMLTFFFEGCRLIDVPKSSQSKKTHYVKCTDLTTASLRPNWRDHFVRRQKTLDQLRVPATQKSFDLAGQPLIDRSDFDQLLAQGHFGSFSELAHQIYTQGFGLLSIRDPNWLKLLAEVRLGLEPHVDLKSLADGTLQPTRFQDAWLHHDLSAVRQVACHPEILSSLQVLYGRIPFPFQTLNFPNGTAQHFHSDAVHFHSLPHGFMCGAWVALEDISSESGPLVYYPGSHRLPYLSARDFGLNQAEVLAEPAPQKFFEPHWRERVATNGYPRCLFEARKGDVLLWHANLLHGGSPVRNKSMSRWSQVTHYFFEGCAYTTPLYQTVDAPAEGHQWRAPIPIRPDDELTNA